VRDQPQETEKKPILTKVLDAWKLRTKMYLNLQPARCYAWNYKKNIAIKKPLGKQLVPNTLSWFYSSTNDANIKCVLYNFSKTQPYNHSSR